jgi:hypothetical protein
MASGAGKKNRKKDEMRYDYFQNKFIQILKPIGIGKILFNDDEILKSRIINVKNPPDTKALTEVSDLVQIKKIVENGKFVSMYEDDNQVIYFTDDYYYVKKK